MKIGKKGFVALAAIVGLLGVGSVANSFQPIFAREETQGDETVASSSTDVLSNSDILESIDETISSDEQLQTSTSESEETSETVSDEGKPSRARLISAQADETAVWGSEAAATKVIEVDNWADFDKAIRNGFTGNDVGKNDADYIKITQSFGNPQTGTSASASNITIPVNRVDFVVDGMNHTIEFHGTSYSWRSDRNDVRKTYVKDLTMYGTNYYGPFRIGDATSLDSELAIENVYYEGGQLTASYQATMRFIGTNTIKSVNSYEDPFTPGRNISTQGNQSGLESFRAVFEENSNTDVQVENGNGFILASYMGNTGSTSGQPAYALLKNKAKVNITTLGSTGENYGVGYYVLALNKGDVTVEDEAELTLNTADGTTKGGIELANGTNIDISNKAKVNININGPMGGTRNAISIGNNSKFNVRDEGELHINLKNQGTDGRDVITAGNDSTFEIGRKSIFNIALQDGTGTRNLINIGARGAFRFADAFSIDLDARANTNAHLINMSNPGHFIADVQKVSTWLKSDPSVLYKSWAPIYGVDVTYNARNQIGLAGQSVTSAITNDFLANYNTSGRSGSQVPPANHTGFSRVLFEFIEDVNIGLNEITDNPNEDTHKEFSGIVNPDPEYGNGTAITFYYVDRDDYTEDDPPPLDRPVGTPSVASPLEGDDRVFHTIADSFTGDYHFDVPAEEQDKLVAGQKIMAVGWLNGKENYVIKTVKDTTAPTADGREYIVEKGSTPPDASVFVENVQDTNPMEDQEFTYAYKTDISDLINQPSLEGHTIEIYVTDEAGNTATIQAKLIVYDVGAEIKAQNIEIDASEIKDKTEDEIKQYILSESNPTAFYLRDGAEVDVTSNIEIADLGGITTTPADYTVKLIVPADPENGLAENIEKEIVVTVKDTEPPVGVGKHILVPLNTPEYLTGNGVDLFKFLSSYSDNVTESEELKIRLVENETEISDLVSSVGDKVIHVILTDKADNDSESIEIPITVVDGEVNGSVAVGGNSFVTDRADWENAENLNDFIIAQASVVASEMTETGVINVTDTSKLTIDTSGVTADSEHEETPMDIILTVSNGVDEVSKTITVTFNDKTAPTADPAEDIRVPLGVPSAITGTEASPKDPRDFITNLKDNVSAADDITVTLDMTTEEIEELVATTGTKSLKVKLTDEKNNSQTIEVPITVFDNSLTVRFVDGSDTDIVTPVMISGHAPGDTVDLTKEKAVTDSIDAVIEQDYQLLTKPESEDAVEVTDDGKVVKYIFDGTLIISSYPTTMDFGIRNVGIFNIRVGKPEIDAPFTIKDNRALRDDWKLTARLDKVLTLQTGDTDDPNYILPDALKYQTGADQASEFTLDGDDQIIETGKNEDTEEYRLSDDWSEEGKGFKLDVPAGTVNKLGEYKAEIVWTLSDVR